MTERPRVREEPEDFFVDELPLYTACGVGDHTYVHVEKRLRTTEEVARLLARAAGARPRDVGYAGRKDRNAVTRQWFSVPGLDPRAACDLELPGVRILGADRHRNKLRTGHLRGNQFKLMVRGVSADRLERAEQAARELAATGMPNRFGAQRFGRDGNNAELGSALLRGEEPPGVGDRRERRFLVSALQSAVFNEVLGARTKPLDELEEGDVAMLHSSGGMFVVEDLARETERAHRFQISPTGPMYGTRLMLAEGAMGEREARVFERFGLPDPGELRTPRGLRLRGGRRPLRVPIGDLSLRTEGEGRLEISVTLPPGSYATVLLEELVGDFDEAGSAKVS